MRELSSNGKIKYDNISNIFIYDFQGPLHREFSLDFDYKCGDEGHVYFDCNDTYYVINVSSSLYNTPKDYGCPFIIYKMEDILNNNIKTTAKRVIKKISGGIGQFYIHQSQNKIFHNMLEKIYVYEIDNDIVAVLDDDRLPDIHSSYYFTNNYKFFVYKNTIDKYDIKTNVYIDTIYFIVHWHRCKYGFCSCRHNPGPILYEKFYYKDNLLHYAVDNGSIYLGEM